MVLSQSPFRRRTTFTAILVAASLGIGLHLRGTHAAVAVLAAFYVIAAVLPWALILFY